MSNQGFVPIVGSKGGSSHTPVEAPDSLRSIALATILDAVSEGEIRGFANGLQSVFLDETPLMNADGSYNFQNVAIDFRAGTQDQEYITGFPSVESETGVNVELKSGTPWTRQLSNINIDAINVRLSVPALSKANTENGDINGYTIRFTIELATDGGSFKEVLKSSISGKTTSKYERGHLIQLPKATTGWIIRVTRTTANQNSSSVADQMTVEAITEIIDAKLRYPNTAVVGVRVNAEQFTSIPTRAFDVYGRIIRVPSNYDPDTRTYAGVWDGTFKPAWSDNPAWIYFDLITHTRYGLGHLVSSSQVDKWNLYKIGRYCDELVDDGNGNLEPRFSCNLYMQTRADAYKALQDLTSVFRSISYYAGGSIHVSADMPTDPVYLFNSSNVINGKFTYAGTTRRQRYTVALVSWNDMSDFGRAKVEYVEDLDGIARYGFQQTEVTAVGCTSRSQARRLGRWITISSRLETDTVTFQVGLDGLVAAPGNIIAVADPNRAGRRIGGRVSSVSGTSTIFVDSLSDAVSVGDKVSVMLPTGVAEQRTIADVSMSARRIDVDSPFTYSPQPQAVWVIESTTLSAQRYRVVSIREEEGLTFSVTALKHATGKYDEIEKGIPWEAPQTTILPSKVVLAPTNVTIDHREVVGEVNSGTAVTISWDAVSGAIAYDVAWRQNEGTWISAGRVTGTSVDVYGMEPGPFEARVVAINSLGIVSPPTRTEVYDIPEGSTPPKVVQAVQSSIQQEIIERIAAMDQEAYDRATELAAEAQARADALTVEAEARTAEVQAAAAQLQARMDSLQAQIGDITGAGEWSSTNTYEVGDLAVYEEKLYSSLAGDNLNHVPTDASWWDLVGNYASLGAAVSAVSAQAESNATRITQAEDALTAHSDSISSLGTRIGDAETGLSGVTNAIDALETTTTSQGNSLTSQGQQITGLNSRLDSTEGALDQQATAINELSTLVTSVEGVTTSQAGSITSLEVSTDAQAAQLANDLIIRSSKDNVLAQANQILDTRMVNAEGTVTAAATTVATYENRLTNAEGAITSTNSAVTSLTSRVGDVETANSGQSSAISALQTTTTNQGNTITSQGSSITSLTSRVTSAENAQTGTTTALNNLTTTVTNQGNTITSQGNSLTNLTSRVTNTENNQTGTSTALNNLTTTVTNQGNSITSQGSSITSLTSRVTNTENNQAGTSTALNNLTTTVTNQGNTITSQGSSITSLTSRVGTTESNISGQASAISTLQTTTSNQGGQISSQASQISSLSSTVNGNTTSINSISSTVNGLQGKVGVTINANGYITGYAMNNNGQVGTFDILADKFRVINPSGSGNLMEYSGGNLNVSGIIQGSLVRSSAMELGSTRIHTGSGRLAPFSIRDTAYKLNANNGVSSMTLSIGGFIGPGYGSGYDAKRFARQKMDVYLDVVIAADDGAETLYMEVQYDGGGWTQIQAIPFDGDNRTTFGVSLRYTTVDSWSTAAFRLRTTQVHTNALSFDLQINNCNESGNAAGSNSGLSATGGASGSAPPANGGGGEAFCVDYQTVLPDGRYVRELTPGDLVECVDVMTGMRECVALKAIGFGYEDCYAVRTAHGEVIQSKSTPMDMRDGSILRTPELSGHELLTHDYGWEIADIEFVGARKVCKPDLGNRMFFAGTMSGRTIATHNIQYKP
jgi:predicted phage tail protein